MIIILVKAECEHLTYQICEGHRLIPEELTINRVLAFSV